MFQWFETWCFNGLKHDVSRVWNMGWVTYIFRWCFDVSRVWNIMFQWFETSCFTIPKHPNFLRSDWRHWPFEQMQPRRIWRVWSRSISRVFKRANGWQRFVCRRRLPLRSLRRRQSMRRRPTGGFSGFSDEGTLKTNKNNLYPSFLFLEKFFFFLLPQPYNSTSQVFFAIWHLLYHIGLIILISTYLIDRTRLLCFQNFYFSKKFLSSLLLPISQKQNS